MARKLAVFLTLIGTAGCNSSVVVGTNHHRTGGASGTGGAAASPGSGGLAGATAGSGGVPGAGSGGSTVTGAGGGAGSAGATAVAALDCGPDGVAIEDAGPPANRVNYVIVGDGYTQAELDTTFREDVTRAVAQRFAVMAQPYVRYRKFVNICALRVPSSGALCGQSALGCCGDDTSHLANCDNTLVNAAIAQKVPAGFMVDWKAVVLNTDHWWNSGGALMYWSGGNKDAPLAALHEGSHGFHQLADEFEPANTRPCTATGSGGTSYAEGNVAGDMATAMKKWGAWVGFDQTPGTGTQGILPFPSGCQFRPSENSIMNAFPSANAAGAAFNAISAEWVMVGMWRYVKPVDEAIPPAGPVSNPPTLQVKVIDPEVINVDWSVDGQKVATTGGAFNVAAARLASGPHTIEARAYDNAASDRLRQALVPDPTVTGVYQWSKNWMNAQQTVTWMVTIP